jgi:hypothetical protein
MTPCAEGDISSQRGTFDMSPSISENIYIMLLWVRKHVIFSN